MPWKLGEHLPGVDATTRAELFGSITDIMVYSYIDPTRQGVISGTYPVLFLVLAPSLHAACLPRTPNVTAYGDVMKLLLIGATMLSVVPLVLSLFMPDWYLGY